MTELKFKTKEVRDYMINGDHHLGLRRLLDCAMDTGSIQFYTDVLNLLTRHQDDSLAISQAKDTFDLLDKMDNLNLTSSGKTGQILLRANDIQKQYQHGNFKMSPVSFELKYNEVIGLVGENGNGKTTLLRMLCKDLNIDNGNIVYKVEEECHSVYQLRSKLIYIPQRVPKWFGSLMDNLKFTIAMHGLHGEENILKAELIVARLGLRPYKHLNWNRISSGYRTRFELAKALLRQPEIMLLDEPLSNLDIISQQTILQDLKHMSGSLQNPFGIILSSQQLYEVEKISDLVIFLKNGSPQYQLRQSNQDSTEQEIIYELETDSDRDLLQQAFASNGLKSIKYNGGVYVLHFNSGTTGQSVFNAIAQNNIHIRYIRNISQSSRRFFIN